MTLSEDFHIPSLNEMREALANPAPTDPLLRPRWATVEQASPLRVKMVGDSAPVAVTPESLVSNLQVGDRVWTGLTDRGALIVVGKSGGSGPGWTGAAPIELGAGVDLDTIITPGVYTQSQNSEAASGFNYPAPVAGVLEVFANTTFSPPSSMIWQRYTSYRHTGAIGAELVGPTTYVRSWYTNTWSPWMQLATEPVLELDTTSFTVESGWSVSYSEIKKLGRFVQYNVRAARTASYSVPADGNITNSKILTITDTRFRPMYYAPLASGSTGAMSAIYVNTDGGVNIGAVANSSISMASGAEFTGGGMWITAT